MFIMLAVFKWKINLNIDNTKRLILQGSLNYLKINIRRYGHDWCVATRSFSVCSVAIVCDVFARSPLLSI